ncbi:MAG: hypothetical protein FWG07_09480 [Treponema sp.]|nr:hypothetical protein [Treponema sp.]
MAESETLNFEKVWAMFKETDQKWQETDRKFQKKREENERKWQLAKEEEEKKRQAAKEEWAKEKKEIDRIIGKLGNRFGEMIEHMVVPGITDKFRSLGFNFEEISQDIKIEDALGNRLAEIDIMLENGDVKIAVEVKSKPNQKDVDDHVARMEFLRKRADSRNDTRKIQGAIAAAIIDKTVRDYAQKAGFYTIEQAGDTIKINIPDDFKPREW